MLCEKFKFIFSLIDILILISCFQLCRSNKTASTPPEVWLSIFQQTGSLEDKVAEYQFRNSSEFKNEFIHKFNKTDYIIQHGTQKVAFNCQANYPVIWYVPHLKQVESFPFEMFKTDTVRVADLNQEPKNKYFQTSLTINFDGNIGDVFSVNLTCEPPKPNQTLGHQFSQAKSSSIHLFHFEGLQAIENSGKVVEIKVPKRDGNDTITIPCRPSLPTASVLIENQIETQHSSNAKDHDQGNIKWKNLTKFTYDPKNGFTITKNKTGSIFGQYRCTLTKKEGETDNIKKEQVVVFNVTFEDSKEPKQHLENIRFEPISNLSSNAIVMYENTTIGKNNPSRNLSTLSNRNPELWCCTGVKKVQPQIYKRKCTSQIQCDILKRSMTFNVMQRNDESFEYNYAINGHSSEDHDDCLSTTLYRGNAVIFCKGENILFGDHLINLFNEKLMPLSTTKTMDAELNLWAFEPESSKAAANISRRIFSTVGHPLKKNQEYEQSMKFTTFIHSNKHTPKESTQYVAEYTRDYFYVGEPLIPICLGWLSFYSHGGVVRVVYANGTSMILNLKEEEKPSKYLLHFNGRLNGGRDYVDGNLIEYTVGKQVLAQKDMVSFECWMPQWNTEEWDKVMFQTKILDAIQPKFLDGVEGNVTTVNFDLGKENATLEWRILGGLPKPTVDVMWDGIRLFSQDFEDLHNGYEKNHVFEKLNLAVVWTSRSNSVEVKISFAKLTKDVHGAYQCKVINVGGTATHTYEVIVEDMTANQTKQN